eukprot:GHRR01026929.1.p1 GENE.GHRR01026929.1~~GHRR01026929.1.p1  ORF type:complete len:200 (+),score=63.56 GHRR01026929.1:87-686(+)
MQGDIRDKELLDRLFTEEKFDAVIHFAGYKAVGESVEKPLEYYDNNFYGSLVLLEVMRKHKLYNIVFSSSCTVYGMVEKTPITEDFPLHAYSPYGRTKLFQEDMFRDLAASDPSWRILLLRYFNPVGAHPSGELGEHPVGVPNNLMPYIQQVQALYVCEPFVGHVKRWYGKAACQVASGHPEYFCCQNLWHMPAKDNMS